MNNNRNDKSERNEKAKEAISNLWKKTSDISKKAAEGAKELAEQTKKNIYQAQAKKYTPVTAKELKSKNFDMPSIIDIVDNSANRKFITDKDSIGWIEQHDDVDVLHIYDSFVKHCDIIFVPVAQRDNVYCRDNFDSKKFINVNQVFGKATEEKLAELSIIAYYLGAKNCSIEIVEAEKQTSSRTRQTTVNSFGEISASSTTARNNTQSGKRVSSFEGHDDPKTPPLKWFAHDENIKGLIEMRFNKAIKSTVLELKGSSSATMSRKLACAIDNVINVKGKLSMEANAIKEHSKILLFEIEF